MVESEEQLRKTHAQLLGMLLDDHTVCVAVLFKKKNGEFREMVCTLREDYIKSVTAHNPKNEETPTRNPNTLVVWDIDKAAWRSFRIDSVFDYKTLGVYPPVDREPLFDRTVHPAWTLSS